MDGFVHIWDTNTFETVAKFRMGNIAYIAKTSAWGEMIAVGTEAAEVALLDPSTGGTLQRLHG